MRCLIHIPMSHLSFKCGFNISVYYNCVFINIAMAKTSLVLIFASIMEINKVHFGHHMPFLNFGEGTARIAAFQEF